MVWKWAGFASVYSCITVSSVSTGPVQLAQVIPFENNDTYSEHFNLKQLALEPLALGDNGLHLDCHQTVNIIANARQRLRHLQAGPRFPAQVGKCQRWLANLLDGHILKLIQLLAN